jgi:hypothetical protein
MLAAAMLTQQWAFIKDLSERLANRVQLSTDGFKAYLIAVEEAFGADIDYAMIVKIYGRAIDDSNTRYSPPECIGCETEVISGKPDMNLVSTSYIERQNLTMRMGMRRFTRLTNGFQRRPKTICTQSRFTTFIITSLAFIRVCDALPQWPLALARPYGLLRILLACYTRWRYDPRPS